MKTRLHTILSVLFVLAVLCVLSPATLQAQKTIYVTPNASAITAGNTWATACDLETAVSIAVAGDQIWVQKGAYNLSATIKVPTSVKLYGGFSGSETSLSQRDVANNPTTLDGQQTHCPVVQLNKLCVFDGFTIQNGKCTGQAQNGGGIWAGDSVVIENCKILNNLAYNGGGIFGKGRVRVINCEVHDNEANGYGADMYGHCLSLAKTPFVISAPSVTCPMPSITAQPSSARYSVVLPPPPVVELCHRPTIMQQPSSARYSVVLPN